MMLADRQNPWLGLAAYGESEQDFFFGRATETAELIRLVEDESLVVFYGVSGLGKTSLLQAGLFPQLRSRDFLPVLLRLYHDAEHPAAAGFSGYEAEMIATVLRAATAANAKAPEAIGAPQTLWEFFHHRDAQFWSARNRLLTPVMLFDQFEEFFTLGGETELRRKNTARFFQQLSDLVFNRPPASFRARLERGQVRADDYTFDPVRLRVVLSLREDFLPQLSELRERGFPTLLKAALRLRPLSGEAARECIERPAPELLAPGVAMSLVRFLAGAESGAATTASDMASASGRVESVEPALLSVVCRELNAERVRRGLAQINADLLTLSQEQILGDFYERSWQGLATELRYFVEDELLSPGGFRDSRALDDALSRPGITQRDIAQLIDRRLLHYQDRQDGPRRIELTHDLLCRVVRASRRRRESEERARAALEAQQRAENESRQLTERAAAAEAARAHEEQLRHEAEAAHARARRRAFLSVTLAVIAIGCTAVTLVMYRAVSRARQQADESRQLAENFAREAAARQAEAQAHQREAEEQRERAATGEKEAQAAKEQAVAARKGADELLHYMQYDLLRDTSGKSDPLATMESINRRIRDYFERFPPGAGDTATLREKSMSLLNEGYILQARGHLDESLKTYRDSLDAAARLAEGNPDDIELQHDVSWRHVSIGGILQTEGQLDAALTEYRTALAIVEKLAPKQPDNADLQRDLAYRHFSVGTIFQTRLQLDDALTEFRACLDVAKSLSEKHPDNADYRYDVGYFSAAVGNVFFSQVRNEEALEAYRVAFDVAQQRVDEQPKDGMRLRDLMQMHMSRGGVYQAQGRFDEALKSFRDGEAVALRMTEVEPFNPDWQGNLAWCRQSAAGVLQAQGKLDEALAEYRDALPIAQRLAQQNLPNPAWQERFLAYSQDCVATILSAQGKHDDALKIFQDSLAIRRKIVEREPLNVQWQGDLAYELRSVGDELVTQNKFAEARTLYVEYRDIADRFGRADPSNYLVQTDRALSRAKIARTIDVTTASGLAEARAAMEDAANILRALRDSAGLQPAQVGWLEDYEKFLQLLATPAAGPAP